MNRWLVLSLALLMVGVPAASAAGWLQPRGDAAATGFLEGQGPAWPDVALSVQVPGNAQPVDDSPPLILDERVIFMGLPVSEDLTSMVDGDMRAYALDLATGEISVVAKVPFGQPMRMATDGSTLFLSGDGAVHARPLAPGGSNWTWTWSSQASPGAEQASVATLDRCIRMTIEAGHVTVLCYLQDYRVQTSAPGVSLTQQDTLGPAGTLVARIEAESGEHSWVRRPGTPSPQTATGPLQDEAEPIYHEWPLGLAVTGERVIVTTLDDGDHCTRPPETRGATCGGMVRVSVRALAAQDGASTWSDPWTSPTFNRTQVLGDPARVPAGVASEAYQAYPNLGNPATSDQAVYVMAGDLYKLNIGTGEKIWNRPIGEQDVDTSQGDFDTAVSLSPTHVYVTTAQTVYRVDEANPQDGWSASLNFSANEGFQEDPIVTPSSVFTASESQGGDEDVHAFDAQTGARLWSHQVANELWAFSVGQGVLAYTGFAFTDETWTTSMVILGQTEASLGPPQVETEQYPGPGEEITVDLSDTEPGAFGAAASYMVDWGDGTVTGWQEDPVFTHTYQEEGEVTARVIAGNDANQTSSTFVTMNVGQEAPTEPNMIETAFARENQDMTFGILGILVAVTGGAVGVGRRYRKRSRLEQELEALETGFEETRDRPGTCEALLETRQARARSLVLDGVLDEQQAAMVENRAEELKRRLRTQSLQEEFGFLPYSLVCKAQEMLEDGRVTSLEREAFLHALEVDEVLTDEQRSLVRERIEGWFARDTGGGASP